MLEGHISYWFGAVTAEAIKEMQHDVQYIITVRCEGVLDVGIEYSQTTQSYCSARLHANTLLTELSPPVLQRSDLHLHD